MRRRAFTLVELLVVMGIIAILIGLLFPVINRARQQAIAIKCASNLGQLARQWHSYAAENRGLAVPGRLPKFNAFNTPKGLKFTQEYELYSQRFQKDDFGDDAPF